MIISADGDKRIPSEIANKYGYATSPGSRSSAKALTEQHITKMEYFTAAHSRISIIAVLCLPHLTQC